MAGIREFIVRPTQKLMKKPLFDFTFSKLDISSNSILSVLDFGCGTGEFLALLSHKVSTKSKLVGVDANEQFIKDASNRYQNINFICQKFENNLSFSDASFDLIITIDAIECILNKDTLVKEFHRILKPGGKVFAAHWDWDTMVYSSKNKDIVRKAVSTFSDWKQPWMDNCDGQMGRKLWGLFEGNKNFTGKPYAFSLIETTYEKGKYGFDRMQEIVKIVDKGRIMTEEYGSLHNELIENNIKGQYFYSLTSFIYYGEKA